MYENNCGTKRLCLRPLSKRGLEHSSSYPQPRLLSTNPCCFQSQYLFVGSNIFLWISCGEQDPYLPIRNCNPLTSMKGNVTLMAPKLPSIHFYQITYHNVIGTLSIFLFPLNCEFLEIRDYIFNQSIRQVLTKQFPCARHCARHAVFPP